ncbi:MAG: hypothetical protein RSB38_09030 [Oscillospiraceae bacterium]
MMFNDYYDAPCTIQQSSVADADAIWFGVDDVKPKVMARDAAKVGVHTLETTGWVAYPIPKEVFLSSRMHLTRSQVKELIPILKHFVRTGEL